MFDFDSVIDDGSADELKECVFAVVWLKPSYEMRIVSSPVYICPQRLRAHWTVDVTQDLVAMHSLRANRKIIKSIKREMKRKGAKFIKDLIWPKDRERVSTSGDNCIWIESQ